MPSTVIDMPSWKQSTALNRKYRYLVRYDEELKDLSELINSAYFQLEEAAQGLDRYRDSISYDEERYAYCQERDSLIYGLKRKYGETIEAVLEFENKAQARLEELEAQSYD